MERRTFAAGLVAGLITLPPAVRAGGDGGGDAAIGLPGPTGGLRLDLASGLVVVAILILLVGNQPFAYALAAARRGSAGREVRGRIRQARRAGSVALAGNRLVHIDGPSGLRLRRVTVANRDTTWTIDPLPAGDQRGQRLPDLRSLRRSVIGPAYLADGELFLLAEPTDLTAPGA